MPVVHQNTHRTSLPTGYFSIPLLDTSVHFSHETPTTSPLSAYSTDILPDPRNPLLALRESSSDDSMSSRADASKLLQLQTTAAHRPAVQPLQPKSATPSAHSAASTSSTSTMGSIGSQMLCCSRCRRESGSGMIQFGTNIYYCNHCARMTGYCAG